MLFTVIACKAQTTTVYSLQNFVSATSVPDNSYIKDTNNDFNKFEGTWKFENNDKKIIMKLLKRERYYDDMFHVYTDILVGEYQYFLNNLEIVNTMANLSNSYSMYSNNISGNSFMRNSEFPSCAECGPNERRVELHFSDPESFPKADGYIILRYINENGIEKIQATIYYSIPLVHDGETFVPPRVPKGTYVFVKQ